MTIPTAKIIPSTMVGWWIGNYVGGSGCGILTDSNLKFAWKDSETAQNTPVQFQCLKDILLFKIRIWYFRDQKKKHIPVPSINLMTRIFIKLKWKTINNTLFYSFYLTDINHWLLETNWSMCRIILHIFTEKVLGKLLTMKKGSSLRKRKLDWSDLHDISGTKISGSIISYMVSLLVNQLVH